MQVEDHRLKDGTRLGSRLPEPLPPAAQVDDVHLHFFALVHTFGFDPAEVLEQVVLGTCGVEIPGTARGIGYRRLAHAAARDGRVIYCVCIC